MPYSMTDVPSAVKNLPKGAQKIFIETFNAVYDEGKDEDKARKAAWSNVKNKYEKDGDKWVRKEKKEKAAESIQVTGDERQESIGFYTTLKEAEFDDESKTATITVIREGWSLNKTGGKQRYYSAKAIESVVKHLNTVNKRKMYKDHKEKARVRYIDEWAATVKEAFEKNNNGVKEAKAIIDFTENPKTVWLYKEAKKHPDEVGISIDASGKIREGKVGDTDAAIIEDVIGFDSTDFVTVAAAGGKVDKINESYERVNILTEAFKSLEDRINDKETYDKPYREVRFAQEALYEFVSDLMYSSEISTGDISKEIDKALNTFSEKIKSGVESIRKRWDNPNVNEGKQRMKLDDFKKEHGEAFEELSEQLNVLAKNEAEKASKEQIEKVTADLEKVQADLKEAKDAFENKEKELADIQLKLDAYETKEKIEKKKQLIESKLVEAKIADKPNEKFISLLMKIEDEQQIQEAINDRAALITEAEGKLVGLGDKPKGKDEKKVFTAEEEKQLLYNSKKK